MASRMTVMTSRLVLYDSRYVRKLHIKDFRHTIRGELEHRRKCVCVSMSWQPGHLSAVGPSFDFCSCVGSTWWMNLNRN
jgi:hypothetical protein